MIFSYRWVHHTFDRHPAVNAASADAWLHFAIEDVTGCDARVAAHTTTDRKEYPAAG
jgi:hypothetical protein